MTFTRKEETRDIYNHHSIPWTNRDIWIALAFLFLGIGILIIVAYLLDARFYEVSLISNWSYLYILVLVWWFTIRKYKVGWSALGFRGFSLATISIAFGLLLLY